MAGSFSTAGSPPAAASIPAADAHFGAPRHDPALVPRHDPARAPFPNLIDNGDFEAYFPRTRPRLWQLRPADIFLWDEFSRGPGGRSLFLDASLIASTAPSPASLRYPLPALRPGAAYLVSLWLARDRNIDGLYPTVSLGGRAFRLSDFWASGRWQKISLVVLVPRLLPPEARCLEVLIPPGDYRLWIDDVVVRRLAVDAAPLRESAPLAFALPSTDRLLDIRLAFTRRNRRFRGGRETRLIRTNNVAGESDDAGLEIEPAADSKLAAAAAAGIDAGGDTTPGSGDPRRVPIAKTISDPLRTTQRPNEEALEDPSAAGIDRFAIDADALAAALPPGRWKARVELYQYQTLLGAADLGAFKSKSRTGRRGEEEGESGDGKRGEGGRGDGGSSRGVGEGPKSSAARVGEAAGGSVAAPAFPVRAADEKPENSDREAAQPKQGIGDSFPVGIYGARIEDFAVLAAAGFNAVHFGATDPALISRALGQAARYGLALLVSPAAAEHLGAALAGDHHAGAGPGADRTPDRLTHAPAPSPAYTPAPAHTPAHTSVQTAAPAPARVPPLYFYLADEPEGRSVSPKLLYRSRAALRRMGFAQPGAIALCRSWRAADYASAVDVFMSDPYPVPFEPLSWLAECLDEIRGTIASGAAESKQVWAVIQAFPWSAASSQVSPDAGRAPTPDELKALVRLALIHGADGLYFYALQSGKYRLREDEALWQAVKDSIAEARTLKPLLDAPPLSPAPTVYCPTRDAYGLSAVHFKAVRSPDGGEPVVIALNTLDRPVQAALRFPGRDKPVPFALDAFELRMIEK